MKKLLLVFLAWISFSTFAGDMYLVCEDEKNDDFLSSSINDGSARIMLTTGDAPLLLDLKQLSTDKSSIYNLRITFLKSCQSKTLELKTFEEVQLGSYVCLVRD